MQSHYPWNRSAHAAEPVGEMSTAPLLSRSADILATRFVKFQYTSASLFMTFLQRFDTNGKSPSC